MPLKKEVDFFRLLFDSIYYYTGESQVRLEALIKNSLKIARHLISVPYNLHFPSRWFNVYRRFARAGGGGRGAVDSASPSAQFGQSNSIHNFYISNLPFIGEPKATTAVHSIFCFIHPYSHTFLNTIDTIAQLTKFQINHVCEQRTRSYSFPFLLACLRAPSATAITITAALIIVLNRACNSSIANTVTFH